MQDFGDGGAYPECHIAQHPLNMGRGDKGGGGGGGGSNALAVQLDDKGKIKYDVLARQGHSKDKVKHILILLLFLWLKILMLSFMFCLVKLLNNVDKNNTGLH